MVPRDKETNHKVPSQKTQVVLSENTVHKFKAIRQWNVAAVLHCEIITVRYMILKQCINGYRYEFSAYVSLV